MAVTVVDGRVVRGERNRQAIADALLACYEDGLLRPSIPEVAARAGVSVRSVHNHFDDIESLRADGVRRQWERFAKLPEPEGPAELIEQRARMYERITPVRRAALLSVHESPTISRNLARFDRILRRQVERVFPSASPEVLDTLDLLLSWDAWNRLRSAQGCSVARAKRVLTETIRTLTEGSAPR